MAAFTAQPVERGIATGATLRRIEYYRAEAERVRRLAEAAEPGHGREQFEQVAQEYRNLADYYAARVSALPKGRH